MKYPLIEYYDSPINEQHHAFIKADEMPELDVVDLALKTDPTFRTNSSSLSIKKFRLCRVNLREQHKSESENFSYTIENWLYVSEKLFNELRNDESKASQLHRMAKSHVNHIVGLNSKYRRFDDLPYLIRADDLERDYLKYFGLSDIKFKFCPECGIDVSGFFNKTQKQENL